MVRLDEVRMTQTNLSGSAKQQFIETEQPVNTKKQLIDLNEALRELYYELLEINAQLSSLNERLNLPCNGNALNDEMLNEATAIGTIPQLWQTLADLVHAKQGIREEYTRLEQLV